MTSILNVSVMPHLNETNYLTWNIRMHTLLIRADLWGIASELLDSPLISDAL